MYGKQLARIVFRKSDKGEADLILGMCFKDQEIFKGGDVWEITSGFDGELILKRVGEGCVGRNLKESTITNSCWGHSLNEIVSNAGGEPLFILTKDEIIHLEESRK